MSEKVASASHNHQIAFIRGNRNNAHARAAGQILSEALPTGMCAPRMYCSWIA